MFRIAEGMVVALVTGRDGEGVLSHLRSSAGLSSLPQELRSQIGMIDEYDYITPIEKAKRIKAIRPRYTDIIGYTRLPSSLAKGKNKLRLTQRNCSSLYKKLLNEIVRNLYE
ncbi:MAG: hypothetical protein M1290_01415 [Candidatus Thermoplasmatota archaeon]|jgi:hypothetical protein|nr:hypothetical protein [Candidatus Thermoplasmatota archaeon]